MTVALHVIKQKLRLCIDMRYVNLWLKYFPFKFEKLSDALVLIDTMKQVDGDAWATLCDLKSGYHHVPLDPKCFTYCCVCIEGEFYVYTVLPFGMAQSVKAFSDVEDEKHRCARACWGYPSAI